MFSPQYFEKLDAYIECLNIAADIAYHQLDYDSEPVDLTPVCSKCLKRRKLDFDSSSVSENGYERNNSGMTSSFDTSQASDMSSHSGDKRQTPYAGKYNKQRLKLRRRKTDLNGDDVDSTFMSAIMKTLVTINSPADTLNGLHGRMNKGNSAGRLRRRHSMLVANSSLFSSNANPYAAVDSSFHNSYNSSSIIDSSTEKQSDVFETSLTSPLRHSKPLQPRPMSYPNYQLQRASTMPRTDSDKKKGGRMRHTDKELRGKGTNTMKKDTEPGKGNGTQAQERGERDLSLARENEPVICNEDLLTASRENVPHIRSEQLSKPVANVIVKIGINQDERSDSSEAEKTSHNMYYSLSPVIIDSPLKVEDLTTTVSAVKVNIKGNEDLANIETDMQTQEIPEGTGCGYLFEDNSSNDIHQSEDKENIAVSSQSQPKKQIQNRKFTAKKFQPDDDSQMTDSNRCVTGDPLRHTMDNTGNEFPPYCHGEGLLYTSSFGIGDHDWKSVLAESDMTKDGYCKCSFCNHDVIITPAKPETIDVTLGYGVTKNHDVSAILPHGYSELKSFSVPMTTSSTNYLKSRHFPYPRLSEEFMTSRYGNEDAPSSKNVDYGRNEDNVVAQDMSVNSNSSQQALQQDIEKHSSGVASVLNLCEVLLHDSDACSNDVEKNSMEQATNSLDRRWRNICALSMERKLKIEETQRLWQRFHEDYSRFSDWLRSAEHVASNPNTQLVSYNGAREELKKFESFQRQVHESLTQLELINKQYRRLARESRTDESNKLKYMIHDGNSRWDSLSHRVVSILKRLKYLIRGREEFESRRESLLVWLTETDLRLTNVEHFMQSENYDKLKEVKNFQATIEEHIPHILELDARGHYLIQKSEDFDCFTIEEELSEFHKYCREVVSRLDRYHKRLLRIMNEPPPLDASLFEDTELSHMNWYNSYEQASSLRDGSPGSHLSDRDHSSATPRSHTLSAKLHGSTGSHSGRATPESLEWDLYDISQSELETKDNGDLTDDGSIPEISPLETANDDVPLLHVSRDSGDGRGSSRTRRSHDVLDTRELALDDLSPTAAKKFRSSQDESSQHQNQFSNDLDTTLLWLQATCRVTDEEKTRSESNFNKTISELSYEVKELKELQKSIEQKKTIVLSINLLSSSFADSDVTDKLSRMNSQWEELQESSREWNKSLQEIMILSEEFQTTLSDLSAWIDLQNTRRDDMVMIQLKESADSSPTSTMKILRKNHKIFDQMRIETLEHSSKVATMQEICTLLHMPLSVNRIQPVEGTRTLSERVRSISTQLKTLLDAIRTDLRDIEHKKKTTRRRIREEHSSASDSESSAENELRASTPIRIRMQQRKVEPSELHSCGRDLSSYDDNGLPLLDVSEEQSKTYNYDFTRESCSSIESSNYDVTHKSLHSGSKAKKSSSVFSKTVTQTRSEMKTTETKGKLITIAMSAKRHAIALPIISQLETYDKKSGYCYRICKVALPFYILMLLLFLLPWFLRVSEDDGLGCSRQNNFLYSFTPMLTYTDGPPPV